MLNIKGIDHLVLRTGQVEQMCLFYCGVLGCTIERETPPDIGLIQLRAGNALIDLVSVDSKLGAMGGGPQKSQKTISITSAFNSCRQVSSRYGHTLQLTA